MNKKCARCLKTVYPVEELKCLDKIWHKSCFRCTECGMALTLKNYKGFNRMPYCSAHMPKIQATPIASTPELKRLTNNTRIQSNVKYHEDYERGKGRNQQKPAEADNVRNKQNTKIGSNVAYRVCKYEHKNIVEQRKRELGDILRKNSSSRSGLDETPSSTTRPSLASVQHSKTRTRKHLPSSASTHSNYSNCTTSSTSSPKITNLSYKSSKFIRKLSSSSNSFGRSLDSIDSTRPASKVTLNKSRLHAGNTPQNVEEIFLRRSFKRGGESYSRSSVDSALTGLGSKATVTSSINESIEAIKGSNITLTASSTKKLTLTDSKSKQEETLEQTTKYLEPDPKMEFPEIKSENESDEPTTSPRDKQQQLDRKSSCTTARIYHAVYDFEAQESDEVSFIEGDRIIEVQPENSGWLTGRVERTGKIGLVPANYVERIRSNTQAKITVNPPKTDNDNVIDDILKTSEQKSSLD